ncbi:MAG: EAL domain-containing protein, partial [Deltaproteobacteria bacterium]|nr:EAL domain-containing protein [Deltaproteobacteria bacterium]
LSESFNKMARDIEGKTTELKKLAFALEQSINIVFLTDIKGNIEYVNPMFEQITGWSKQEAIGQNPRILASGETTRAQYEELWNTILAGKTYRYTFKNKKKNGQYYWATAQIAPIKDERGEVIQFLAMQEDITEKKKAEERAEYLAHYDEMTGLYNRVRFMELMDKWIQAAQGSGKVSALLLIDIDEFKSINEIYGHNIGDEFLRHAAGLLKNSMEDVHRESVLAHLGGDEFAVFITDVNEKDAMDIAEVMRKRIEGLYFTPLTTRFTASIGIALYPEHGAAVRELLSRADIAMYRAKASGRNRCHLYQPEDHDLEKIHSRLKEKELIQNALNQDRFLPWFQPILDLKDNKIHHCEALARMRGEDGAILLPGAFIDTAEIFGLIGAIDRVIIEKTMRLQAAMSRQGSSMSFGMNLSGKDLGDEDILSFLRDKIIETGADPAHLMFEITETAAIHDMDKAVKFIKALKAIGCHFSLDDFGVGFTSFIYLREMGVDYIKIDGSFIKRLHEDNNNDKLFVKAIVDVAKGMGIKTVAEFVENEEIIKLLKKIGVDYAQGYAIGKPAPWTEIKLVPLCI